MNMWTALLDVFFLLLGAMLLGALFERIKQNAVLGYLLAGALLGPHTFNLVPNHEAILSIAELGVALLLFSIGLEFSWRRLRSIGAIGLGGGSLQILVTAALATWAGRALGLELSRALAVGVMIALSSTAVVMRLLADRTEIDSIHGRNALGILLLQDIAVVPLVFLVTALAGEGSSSEFGWAMARALGTSLLLAGALFVLLKYVIPRLFRGKAMSTNRDLPVLLAMVTAVGCALGAHALGLSPVLGAFVGGMMLAESPFATQVRADLTPLKTLFVTLFFASIGMLINPGWVIENWSSVGALVAAIIFGKMIIVSTVALVFRSPIGHAVATGLCLAQLGEFSFVLLNISRSAGLISADLFDLMIAAI
ncbi:MAG: sodium:proton exchanger, partial [Deltaproteobacteria bacterium]|nr:sodium:proton exchanger [Deltaproteobacteria bacterium]